MNNVEFLTGAFTGLIVGLLVAGVLVMIVHYSNLRIIRRLGKEIEAFKEPPADHTHDEAGVTPCRPNMAALQARFGHGEAPARKLADA